MAAPARTVGIVGLGFGRAHIPAFQSHGCIAPLVKRFLAATRKGQSPSPSFEDGMRAQAVLDAVLESIASGGGMVSI